MQNASLQVEILELQRSRGAADRTKDDPGTSVVASANADAEFRRIKNEVAFLKQQVLSPCHRILVSLR